jgi:hypothetical protein
MKKALISLNKVGTKRNFSTYFELLADDISRKRNIDEIIKEDDYEKNKKSKNSDNHEELSEQESSQTKDSKGKTVDYGSGWEDHDRIQQKTEEIFKDRPKWDKPPYPDFEKIAEKSNDDEEYDERLQRYVNRHEPNASNNDLAKQEFDNQARKKLDTEFPDVSESTLDRFWFQEKFKKDKEENRSRSDYHNELMAHPARENIPFEEVQSDDSGVDQGSISTPSYPTSPQETNIETQNNTENVNLERNLRNDNDDNDDDDGKNNSGGGSWGNAGEGSSGTNLPGGSSNNSSKTMIDSLSIFFYGTRKNDDYLSPLDYIIEIEQDNPEISLFDIDI